MEDTYISILNFNENPELSLFAIFDGHAGTFVSIQVVKSQSLWETNSRNNSRKIQTFILEIMPKRSDKPSLKWTKCSNLMQELGNFRKSFKNSAMKKMPKICLGNQMQDVPPWSVW